MSFVKEFAINLKEDFPHLPKAPIVEAIIDLRANPEVPWEEGFVRSNLDALLVDYKFLDSQQEIQHEIKMKDPDEQMRRTQWKGLRYISLDGKNIGQFNRDGFVFRRLPPYEDWAHFHGEAMRLWEVYLALAKCTEIQRMGLRFINRIEVLPPNLRIQEYISGGPVPPEGLETLSCNNFMHHDTWLEPPFAVNVVRVLQRLPNQVAIILDLDVFSTTSFELNSTILTDSLTKMRWLKNKSFFGIISKQLITELTKPR
jgi:uncharacterized protein (TIGR04255 family)